MSETMVSVDGLGKRFTIVARGGHPAAGYRRLSEEALDAMIRPFAGLATRLRGRSVNGPSTSANTEQSFWALRDVSFEVKGGEVLGIIGRNGAGKSTLLKILSRITEPSEGRARLRGRVASLLEIGTGFHPELTGRENIFLNGAILGMPRAQIREKLDEIVAFAEIERFVDTPVKRYSSGMHVRLGFSVAAHLQPDTLIVDEVLAVGDAEFQKKCLGKIKGVANDGRTVLFVSHNMSAVESFCSRALLLEAGRCVTSGDIKSVVRRYLSGLQSAANRLSNSDAEGGSDIIIRGLRFQTIEGEPSNRFLCGESFRVEISGKTTHPYRQVSCAVGIYDELARRVAYVGSDLTDTAFDLDGDFTLTCELTAPPIFPGQFSINVALFRGQVLHYGSERCGEFFIEDADFFGSGRMPPYGPVLVKSVWMQHSACGQGGDLAEDPVAVK